MTREEAVKRLRKLENSDDPEVAHSEADDILADLLNGLGFKDVVAAWGAVPKWYA